MLKLYKSERFNCLPDAILFDTDNTLYPYDPAHAGAMRALRDKVTTTFSIGKDAFDNAYSEARRQVKSRLKNTAASHSRLLYLQKMLEIIGLGSQAVLALDFEQTYWRAFLKDAVLFEEVKELLDDLRLLGIPTAIVTDLTAQIQFRKIAYFGLDQHFDYIITSEEAGSDKPSAAPFNIALEKIRPKGNCIWMVGDDCVSDIRGAREQISAVTLQKLHEGVIRATGADTPDAAFDDFASLRRLLQKLVGSARSEALNSPCEQFAPFRRLRQRMVGAS